jgi:glycosyltransferase involved in cell wall biosynthesis
MNQILVVIPAYNCSKELVKVLSKIVAKPMLAHVTYWVVDNLSHDDTYETARKFVLENKIKNIQIYQALENNSLGGTHKIAFNEGIKSEYDYVAIFHGDNQGDYSDLYNILIKLENENPHCSYLGNRFSRQSSLTGYSRKRIFGNLTLNVIYSLKLRQLLMDLGSGLNVFWVETLKGVPYMNFGDSLTFNYELTKWLAKESLPIQYFPINWKEEGQVSNARNVDIFLKGLKILFGNSLNKMEPGINTSKKYGVRGLK